MCVDKIEFLEINWIFNEIYENDSLYLKIYNWNTENVSRFNAILTFGKICGYIILFISIVGVLMNLVVIIVLLFERKDANSTTVFILSLAFSDITTVFICGPISTVNLLWGDWAFEQWFGVIGAKIICKMLHMFYTFCVIVSSFTLCFMTLERFSAVYFPLKFRSQRTVRRALNCVVGIWLFAAIAMSPTLIYSDVRLTPTGCRRCYTGYPHIHYLAKLSVISWVDSLATYVIPLAIILSLNIAIVVKVWKMGKFWKGMKNVRRTGHKTSIMVVLIVSAFAFCWFPFQCLYLMEMFHGKVLKQKFAPEYLIFGYTLGYANSCVNPIIYSILSVNFRKSCSETFKRFTSSLTHSTKSTSHSKGTPDQQQQNTPL